MPANPILIIVSFMLLASLVMLAVSSVLKIDSNYDLFFETNTLVIVTYIYFVARRVISQNRILQSGALLLIFNLTYDVATELEFLDIWADQHELLDTFLEDGLLQTAFLLIAIGVTQVTSHLKEASKKDELTGLYNRKKFNEIKLEEFELVFLDLDGLKTVNDRKGHNVGDLMIVRFSQVLAKSTLDEDEMVFRVGGDEFVVTTRIGRSAEFISQVKMQLEGEKLSFSYGIEKANRANFKQALIQSDKAMYEMKKSHKENIRASYDH
ncbi:GGDEF domain-containing protein [Vibrio sp. 99-70-13A1]|uniref:GGDEF domain-containing protein n=1 Tax=Vibrio sp. 99-70-13A1 TaxID=2607601 RepID=UPI0014938FEB|nr:GGDEF domain-containing protein [Vibrio sp. 99-70-13A1]NOH96321.1 GGDEF domain-containing protein [Vibrio sp. 99-70-13A1]